jgi:tetratricopeptide (TPR) repeat protein
MFHLSLLLVRNSRTSAKQFLADAVARAIPFAVLTGLSFPGLAFQSDAPQPLPPVTAEMRCDIMMARKLYREAVECFKAGSETSAIMANKTGIAYHQLGRPADMENAQKYYEKAIKLNPKYAEAINNLGTVYYARKSYRRAVSQYRKALTLRPDFAPFLANLGTAYFARKQYSLASTAYGQALGIDPDIFERRSTQGSSVQDQTVEERAKFHYYVAKTYAQAGVNDRAIQYIRKCLEEGFKDREKFFKEPEFAGLREDPEFKQLMAAEQKVL